MSGFHERLVEARRTGVPAVSSPAPEAPAQSDSAVKGTLTPLAPGVFRCDDCAIPVDAEGAPAHVDWHRRLGH